MAREHFVVRFCGDGAPPADDVERIRDLTGAEVLDESPRMLLVNCHEQPLRDLVDSMPQWALAAEQYIPVPDTRQGIRRTR